MTTSRPTDAALLKAQRDANARQASLLRTYAELLTEVAGSGVEFEDPRVKYVVVQIDRDTWQEIKELPR